MNTPAEQVDKRFRFLKYRAMADLIVLPILLLSIAQRLCEQPSSRPVSAVVPYVFWAIAAFGVYFGAVFERMVAKGKRRKPRKRKKEPVKFAAKIARAKTAFVAAVYIYGFIVVLMTRDLTTLFFFYPLGIVGSFFVWPTRARFEKIVVMFEELASQDPAEGEAK